MITQVEIPKETLTQWEGLLTRGDIALLMALLKKKSRTSIYSIFETGKSDAVTVAKLTKFFTARLQEIQTETDQD